MTKLYEWPHQNLSKVLLSFKLCSTKHDSPIRDRSLNRTKTPEEEKQIRHTKTLMTNLKSRRDVDPKKEGISYFSLIGLGTKLKLIDD